MRRDKKKRLALVKWKGYDDSFNSWILLRYIKKGLKTFQLKALKNSARKKKKLGAARCGLETNKVKTSRACEGSVVRSRDIPHDLE